MNYTKPRDTSQSYAFDLHDGCTGCFARHDYLPTVDYVDLQQIEGDWFVSHHIPYWLEKGKLAPVDAYKLREDGKIDVEYRFRPDDIFGR